MTDQTIYPEGIDARPQPAPAEDGQAAIRGEFYGKREAAGGGPEDDLPGTVRVESWTVRKVAGVRRAVRLDLPAGLHRWAVFAGPLEETGTFLADEHVKGWHRCPDTPDLVTYVAYRLAAGDAPGASTEGQERVQEHERGDMGPEAFMGERSPSS